MNPATPTQDGEAFRREVERRVNEMVSRVEITPTPRSGRRHQMQPHPESVADRWAQREALKACMERPGVADPTRINVITDVFAGPTRRRR
jgi:hypothetical protein